MSEKTTKRGRGRSAVGELAAEYRFDYSKSRPNRFAKGLPTGAAIVVLEPDVAKVFRNSKQVNAFLRSAIAATAKPRSRRTG